MTIRSSRQYAGAVLLAMFVAATLVGSVEAFAPSGQSNPRLRDESFRPVRLLPMLSAALGLVCYVRAAREGRARLARRIGVGTALVTTALALVPVVMTGPRPLNRQPSPDAQEYADATRQLASGNGYVTTFRGGVAQPPRYPPGFSVALAPFAALGPYPAAVQLGSMVYAMLYVVAVVGAAWVIGGPLAAAVAGALVGTSPFALRFGSLVMSDAFAAGLTMASLALVHRAGGERAGARAGGSPVGGAAGSSDAAGSSGAAKAVNCGIGGVGLASVLAGAVAGALVTVRLSAIVQIPGLLIGLTNRQRASILFAAAPFIVALGLFQWATFGSPFRTGYDYWLPEIQNFALGYPLDADLRRDGSGVVGDALDGALVGWSRPWPDDDPVRAFRSILFYPLVLLGAFWIFAPPLTTLPGLVYVWRHRREPAAGFALWLVAGSLVFYLFYFYMGARFMAAPASALAVFTGVAVARWAERVAAGRHAARGARGFDAVEPDAVEPDVVAAAALSGTGAASAENRGGARTAPGIEDRAP